MIFEEMMLNGALINHKFTSAVRPVIKSAWIEQIIKVIDSAGLLVRKALRRKMPTTPG